MFKLLYRGKRGAERAEALLGPHRDDGPALFYRPFIPTAWNDRLAGGLRFLPGCAKASRAELPRAVVFVAAWASGSRLILPSGVKLRNSASGRDRSK